MKFIQIHQLKEDLEWIIEGQTWLSRVRGAGFFLLSPVTPCDAVPDTVACGDGDVDGDGVDAGDDPPVAMTEAALASIRFAAVGLLDRSSTGEEISMECRLGAVLLPPPPLPLSWESLDRSWTPSMDVKEWRLFDDLLLLWNKKNLNKSCHCLRNCIIWVRLHSSSSSMLTTLHATTYCTHRIHRNSYLFGIFCW